MNVDIRSLKTFVSVVECGSVVGAARQRGYSPASVSRQISGLQRRLGVRLFVPDGRSIRPTAQAIEFVESCRGLVETVERFESYADDFAATRAAAR